MWISYPTVLIISKYFWSSAKDDPNPNTSLFCLFKVWEAADGLEKTNKSAANESMRRQIGFPLFYTTSSQPTSRSKSQKSSIWWLRASFLSVHLAGMQKSRDLGAIRRVPFTMAFAFAAATAASYPESGAESTFCSPAGTADGKIVIWIGANRWGCNFSTTWTPTKGHWCFVCTFLDQ